MKHFYFDILFTLVALLIAGYWGYSHAGMTAMMSALLITAILALMEVSLSFDNAVVNASILKHWDKYWQMMFLTVGMIVAVFGMRLVFPIVIVAVTADMSMGEVVQLALNNPTLYSEKLVAHHAQISAFGGMFLLLVFLNFVFDERDVHWFTWLERRLTRLGKEDAMSVFVAMLVLMLFLSWVEQAEKLVVLTAGIWGILTHLAISTFAKMIESSQGLDSLESLDLESLENPEGLEIQSSQQPTTSLTINTTNNSTTAHMTSHVKSGVVKAGVAGFVYLEVLDASFSFDGVIGAFAITNDVVIIMLGLAIGAMFVRSLTIYFVRAETLDNFVYLEHGAHYAIGALAIIMLLSVRFHIPELATGLIGISFIALSMISSIRLNRAKS